MSQAAAEHWGVWQTTDSGLYHPWGGLITVCGPPPSAHHPPHPVVAGIRQGDHVLVPVAQLESLAARLRRDCGDRDVTERWEQARARAAAAYAPAPAGTGGAQ